MTVTRNNVKNFMEPILGKKKKVKKMGYEDNGMTMGKSVKGPSIKMKGKRKRKI